MKYMFKASPLYNFLNYCNESSLEKNILDCGAGGLIPPLSIFKEEGYNTLGIDISLEQVKRAEIYCKTNDIDLNIIQGDMRYLKLVEESFSFAYSFNSIFHMKKDEIYSVVSKMKDILKQNGLCFVNVLSIDDNRCGDGEKIGDNEFLQEERKEIVIHSYFKDTEFEENINGFQVLYKEKRIIEKTIDGKSDKMSYIDYILLKI